MLNKNTGYIGLALGVILALVGVYFWVATYHHKTALGFMGLGVIVLVAGLYAMMVGGKTGQVRR